MVVNNVGGNKFTAKLDHMNVIESAKNLATDDKGTKALTLDKKGRLTTVDLNRKNNDGKAAKFFKGVTNKTYRRENWGLEKKQKTARNPDFVAALGQKVSLEATVGTGLKGGTDQLNPEMLAIMKSGGKADDMKFMQLFNKVTADKTVFTPNDIANSKVVSEASSEQFENALGKEGLNVTNKDGKSQNIVDFIKENTTKDKNAAKNMVKGAAMQSINAAVLRTKEQSMERLGQTRPSLSATGLTVKNAMNPKSPTNKNAVSFALGKGMDDMMLHLKDMVDTGRKNGLSDNEIADKLFLYCGEISRGQPDRSVNPELFHFGDSRVMPDMKK